MKVHLIKEKTIRHFIAQYPGCRASFEEWFTKLKLADWNVPTDIKHTFPNTDLLGNGSFRVIFNIAGNRYRMICKYAFGESAMHMFVCWIGTHAAYDILCRDGMQYKINIY